MLLFGKNHYILILTEKELLLIKTQINLHGYIFI